MAQGPLVSKVILRPLRYSVTWKYYAPFQAFLALSVGGTVFHGYFFAFHLLNIVNNNQLLGGVIKAVTQNGMFCEVDRNPALFST